MMDHHLQNGHDMICHVHFPLFILQYAVVAIMADVHKQIKKNRNTELSQLELKMWKQIFG